MVIPLLSMAGKQKVALSQFVLTDANASVDSVWSGGSSKLNAFDQALATTWIANAQSPSQSWFRWDGAMTVKRINYSGWDQNFNVCRGRYFTLQGSNNGSAWTNIGTQQDYGTANIGVAEFDYTANNVQYLFHRVLLNGDDGLFNGITEISCFFV